MIKVVTIRGKTFCCVERKEEEEKRLRLSKSGNYQAMQMRAYEQNMSVSPVQQQQSSPDTAEENDRIVVAAEKE